MPCCGKCECFESCEDRVECCENCYYFEGGECLKEDEEGKYTGEEEE
jgi:hypothetical protein